MIIEIGYTYQLDKTSPAQQSWTYFYVKGEDLTKAKTKAKTYWKKFVSEHGWGKKAKLTHIEAIQNEFEIELLRLQSKTRQHNQNLEYNKDDLIQMYQYLPYLISLKSH